MSTVQDKPLGELVELFIKLRDAKRAADVEFKKSMERLNTGMERLEGIMLTKLQEQGGDSFACDAGTVYVRTDDSATVQDRTAFKSWLQETANWDVADIRANKVAVRTLLEEGKEVPGVKFTSIQSVGVRRS